MREFVPDGTNFDDMMVKSRESFRKYRIRTNEPKRGLKEDPSKDLN